MGKLDGRVAFITGARPDIGGAIAARMSREGAKIAANDIVPEIAKSTADYINSTGGTAIAVPGDVSDEAQVKGMIKSIVDSFGYVDIVVNNARMHVSGGLLETTLDGWNKTLAVLLNGAMLCSREAAKVMVEKGRQGCIINILSSQAYQGSPGNLAYNTSKGGLLNFTRAAAMDLAYYGIRVVAIGPTIMEHGLYKERTNEAALPGATDPSSAVTGGGIPLTERKNRWRNTMEDYLRGIPLGVFPRPIDIANAAVFLASDDARMITGSDIKVDAGTTSRNWSWTPGAYDDVKIEDYIRDDMEPRAWGEVPL